MKSKKSKIFKQYKNTEVAHFSEKSPIQVIGTILNELERSMTIVADKIENEKTTISNNNIKSKSNHFTRAMLAIYSLQTSLDFEEGGDLSIKLFQLYEYCRTQLIKGFARKVVDGIRSAVNALKEILLAWEEMEQNAK